MAANRSALQRALRRVVYVPDVSERLAAVAWLEAEAASCPQPEGLALRDYGDLLPVVQMCRSSSMEVYTLAQLRADAHSPSNGMSASVPSVLLRIQDRLANHQNARR